MADLDWTTVDQNAFLDDTDPEVENILTPTPDMYHARMLMRYAHCPTKKDIKHVNVRYYANRSTYASESDGDQAVQLLRVIRKRMADSATAGNWESRRLIKVLTLDWSCNDKATKISTVTKLLEPLDNLPQFCNDIALVGFTLYGCPLDVFFLREMIKRIGKKKPDSRLILREFKVYDATHRDWSQSSPGYWTNWPRGDASHTPDLSSMVEEVATWSIVRLDDCNWLSGDDAMTSMARKRLTDLEVTNCGQIQLAGFVDEEFQNGREAMVRLEISGCDISDGIYALDRFRPTLPSNHNLRHLHLERIRGRPDDPAVIQLLQSLRENNWLEHLHLEFTHDVHQGWLQVIDAVARFPAGFDEGAIGTYQLVCFQFLSQHATNLCLFVVIIGSRSISHLEIVTLRRVRVFKHPETSFRLKVNGMGRKLLETSMDWNNEYHKWLWYKALEDNRGDMDLTFWLMARMRSAKFLLDEAQAIRPFVTQA